MQTEFSAVEWREAAQKVASGQFPVWIKNPLERQAYALGVFSDDHIEPCVRCKGEGDHISYDGPDCRGLCMACRGSGQSISEEGKARIKVVFPGYRIRER